MAANLNALVEFFQKNPQIIQQFTSGKLDLTAIVNLLKQQGMNYAQQEVQNYINKQIAGNIGNIAGSILGGSNNSTAAAAGSILGGLGDLLKK